MFDRSGEIEQRGSRLGSNRTAHSNLYAIDDHVQAPWSAMESAGNIRKRHDLVECRPWFLQRREDLDVSHQLAAPPQRADRRRPRGACASQAFHDGPRNARRAPERHTRHCCSQVGQRSGDRVFDACVEAWNGMN
jgi:hypothetical protein